MRLNVRHVLVAIVLMLAQLVASASTYDHIGDPLHSHDECAICTTIGVDTGDGVPTASGHVDPVNLKQTVTSLMPAAPVVTECPTSYRVRAPPCN